MAKPRGNILLHRHLGEEGVALKQQADPPLLGRQINAGLAVKQNPLAQNDAPAIRADQACQTPQGQTFAAARGAQQAQDPALGGQIDPEREAAETCLKFSAQHRGPSFPEGSP